MKLLHLVSLLLFASVVATDETIETRKITTPSGQEFTLFEGDIIASYVPIASAYGVEFADELVEKGIMEAPKAEDSLKERGSVKSLDLWRFKWSQLYELWIIKVYFQPNAYTDTELQFIKSSLRKLQKYSGVIRFKWLDAAPTDGKPFIHIGTFGNDICSSLIGVDRSAYTADGQFMFIGKSCMIEGQIQHEMMHCLGFFHEQSRPDRNAYVTINEENIEAGQEHNFAIAHNVDSRGSPYDYNSVMHYDEYKYSTDPSLKTIDANGNAVGQRTRISWQDNLQIRYLYQCFSGPRNRQAYNNNRCTEDCKCGWKKKGCKLTTGLDDSAYCKGSLICESNVCMPDKSV